MSYTHLDRALRHWPDKDAEAELAALRGVEKAARVYLRPESCGHVGICACATLEESALDAALDKLDALRAKVKP